MTRLSLCMILRNEAATLPDFLAAHRELFDEWILVDTGSTDATPQIIEQQTGHRLMFPWGDDFSAARNFSLQQATGDWILVLDPDEYLAPADQQRLRTLITNAPKSAYRLTQRTYHHDAGVFGFQFHVTPDPWQRNTRGYVDLPVVRLMPNDPALGWRFVQRIHEGLESTDPGQHPVDSGLRLHHYGALKPARTLADKQAFYAQLEAVRIAEQPDDPESLRQFGAACLARRDYTQATAVFSRALAIEPDHPQAHCGLIMAQLRSGQHVAADQQLSIALSRWPHERSLLNLRGVLWLETGAVERAEALFTALARRFPDDYLVHYNLGLCALAGRQFPEALACFSRAGTLYPAHADSWYNLALVQHALQQHHAACATLTHLLTIDPHDRQCREKLAEWTSAGRTK